MIDATAHQLVKVLASNGIAITARGIVELCGTLDVAGCLRGLRRAGVDARLVRLTPGDLAFLPKASLVWLDDGPPAVVIATSPRWTELELHTGETRRISAREATAIRARAIAVRAASQGNSFVRQLLANLVDDERSRRAIAVVVATSLVVLALGLAVPFASRLALEEAVLERAPSKLVVAALAIVLLSAHVTWATWVRRRALLYIEVVLDDFGVERAIRRMLGLPFLRLARLEVGEIIEIARIVPEVARDLVVLFTCCVDAIIALGYVAVLFWLDPACGIAAVVGGSVVVGLGAVFGRRAASIQEAASSARQKHQQGLVEIVGGIETIRAEAAESRMLVRLLGRLVSVQALAVQEQTNKSRQEVLTTLTDHLAYGAILLIVSTRVLQGTAGIGDMLAALQASACFFASAQSVARFVTVYCSLRGYARRINDTLGTACEPLDVAVRTNAAPEDPPALVLRNVWFRYDRSTPWVLQGVDVTVPRGASVVLEWPSGTGKSTLLRLLAGLVEPERGDALVFGMEAARARHLTAYLPQDAALLPFSIIENLRLMSGGASLERLASAADATGLSTLVKEWPMGFETVIAPNGGNLSSGQRQLVLFTAALASSAPILLLDEALAHMDAAMRTKLSSLDLLRGRTVIAVVHDASSYEEEPPQQARAFRYRAPDLARTPM